MNRRLLACLLILTLLFAFLVAYIVIVQQRSSPGDLALSIALSDPDVKTAIANDQGNYKVVSVMPQSRADPSGYINVNDTLYIVNLSMQGGMFAPDREVVFVDMDRRKVIGSEWYSYRGFPSMLDITLPPGASYYHILGGPIMAGPNMGDEFGVQTFWGAHLNNLAPENATVLPILVDEAGLSSMKNGSSYRAAEYNDTGTNRSAVMNGTYAISPGWNVNASVKRPPAYGTGNWPDFDMSQKYYLVLKNAGIGTVNINLGS